VRRISVAALSLALAACQQQGPEQSQRVALEDRPRSLEEPQPSPDTEAMRWRVNDNGHAIDFGQPGEAPLLTLDCEIAGDDPHMRIIRHAAARPGQSALFPIIGNGYRSRFPVDATLEDGEWRWEGMVPADDPQLRVFGKRKLLATLPGRGMLEIGPSTVPPEFVDWCRAGGELLEAVEEEQEAGSEQQEDPAEDASAS
jgi:hypothetical protein